MTDRSVQDTAFEADRAKHLAQETFDIDPAAFLGLRRRVGELFARAVMRAEVV